MNDKKVIKDFLLFYKSLNSSQQKYLDTYTTLSSIYDLARRIRIMSVRNRLLNLLDGIMEELENKSIWFFNITYVVI